MLPCTSPSHGIDRHRGHHQWLREAADQLNRSGVDSERLWEKRLMSMSNRVRASLLLLTFLTRFAGADPQEPGDIMARVDDVIHSEMQRQKVPGVALGIVRKGQVIAAKG